MTKQHKATPEQWTVIEKTNGGYLSACILELRARVEALEAARQPHQHKVDRLIALDADDGDPIVMPSSPAGSLAERVARLIAKFASEGLPGDDAAPTARAAILEVAAWFRTERDSPETAAALGQEANR
jgi:hypothetical protein